MRRDTPSSNELDVLAHIQNFMKERREATPGLSVARSDLYQLLCFAAEAGLEQFNTDRLTVAVDLLCTYAHLLEPEEVFFLFQKMTHGALVVRAMRECLFPSLWAEWLRACDYVAELCPKHPDPDWIIL